MTPDRARRLLGWAALSVTVASLLITLAREQLEQLEERLAALVEENIDLRNEVDAANAGIASQVEED